MDGVEGVQASFIDYRKREKAKTKSGGLVVKIDETWRDVFATYFLM